jgi:predicted anti-sigma-YlaC factor YlaD
MPTCREMSELVTDYVEHSLPWRVRFAAWRHLRVCDMCRAYYDQIAKLRRLLGRTPMPPPPPATEDALLAAARGTQPPSPTGVS